MAFGKNFYANTNCFMGLRFCLNTRQKKNKQRAFRSYSRCLGRTNSLAWGHALVIYWFIECDIQHNTLTGSIFDDWFSPMFSKLWILFAAARNSRYLKSGLWIPLQHKRCRFQSLFFCEMFFSFTFSYVLFQKLKKNTEIESRLLSLCLLNELFVCIYWLSRFHLKKNSF